MAYYTTFTYTCDIPLNTTFNAMSKLHNFLKSITINFHAECTSGEEVDESGTGNIMYIPSSFLIDLSKSDKYTVTDKSAGAVIMPSDIMSISAHSDYKMDTRKIIYTFTLDESYTDQVYLSGDYSDYYIEINVNNNVN